MAKDYTKLANEIMKNIGGEENVKSLTHCMTRLRFVIKDENNINLKALKQTEGVIDVIVSGGQHQVVIGTHVTHVYDAILEMTSIGTSSAADTTQVQNDGKKKNKFEAVMDLISSIFLPLMPAMCGAGILKGLLIALTTAGIMSSKGGTYTVLYAAADAFFYFLPIALAYTSAEKFKTDKFVAMIVAAALVYPTMISAFNSGKALQFLGISFKVINYTSSVIPAIVSVYALSKLEKLLKKLIPDVVKLVFVPLICIVVMVPATLLIIGPLTTLLGNGIAAGYSFIFALCPPVAGFLIAMLWPICIIFGAHWGLVPIVMTNIVSLGYDTLLPVTTACNFAQAGAVFAVFLKTKNKTLKQAAGTSAFSALIGGVTEPAIYGVNLKYKRPFVIALIFTGIGGIIISLAGGQFPALITTCVLTLPAIAMFKGGIAMVIASAIGFFGTTICTYLFGFNDSMIEE